MESMFEYCYKLNRLDLTSFNTSKVYNTGYMFNECNNMTAIYVGDDWNMDAVIYSYRMFYNCTSLRGDMGTTYDEDHVDKAYAHLDGGPTNPGYLSMKPEYMRGDVDGDGEVSISDVSMLIDYLLTGNASGVDLTGADADQDGEVAIADVSAIIDYLLSGNW